MFGSDILDVVIGMVFIFLLLSLVCSALNELLEALLKNRARDLERGIGHMIGDPANASKFIDAIYNHGMVNSLFKGAYPAPRKGDLPSYIPAKNFALAVMDLVKSPPAGVTIPRNVEDALRSAESAATGNAAKVQASLEAWFNNAMDRVSGWYKCRVQWIILVLGLIVAIALNADTLRIARSLANDASLRKGLVATAEARASRPPALAGTAAADQQQIEQDLATLDSLGLPIGWGPRKNSGNISATNLGSRTMTSESF